MDPRLLDRYTAELEHLRSTGAEFARDFPKIAGRLGLGGFECADPYVERLLEGFAFLAARIQLRFDDGFPLVAESLLSVLAPHLLAPVPAMGVARFVPDPANPALASGPRVPRGTILSAHAPAGEETAPRFATAAACDLLPFSLGEAAYHVRDLPLKDPPAGVEWRSALRLRLNPLGQAAWDRLACDRLRVQILGADETAWSLAELLLSSARAVVVDSADGRRLLRLGGDAVVMPGLGDDEALLPVAPQAPAGARLLAEYFSFPERFCAFAIDGIGAALRACGGQPLDITILLGERREPLARVVDAQRLALHTVPVVNLFPRRCERVPLDGRSHEHHLVPDRTRPQDYEIHSVLSLEGWGEGGERLFEAIPFAAVAPDGEDTARFAARRRVPVGLARRNPAYQGSEVWAVLTGRGWERQASHLRQLGGELLCTNRDLTLSMPVGGQGGDFQVPSGLPASRISCVLGPTAPLPSAAGRDAVWAAIGALRLNHLSLAAAGGQAAAGLRQLLELHARGRGASAALQAQGLAGLTVRDVVRRIPGGGAIAFARGLETALTFDAQAFQGSTCLPLGRILAELFSGQVSVNSFAEVVLATNQHGTLVRWPARMGTQLCL